MAAEESTGLLTSMADGLSATSKSALDEILVCLLRGESVDWAVSKASFSNESEFSEALLERAIYHGVDALLCHELRSGDTWQQVPPPLQESLSHKLRQSVAIEMVREKDLQLFCLALKKAGIPVLILKGGALAYTHYPAPYLRSRGDTDLYISPKHIRPLRKLAAEMGYELGYPVYKSRQFTISRASHGQGAVNYDVHWRPFNHASYAAVFSDDEMWLSAQPLPQVDGAFSLGAVQALLLACIHRLANSRHDPSRLVWLYDIHLMLNDISGPELIEFVQKAALKNVHYECTDTLVKLAETFRTEIPQAAISGLSIQPKPVKTLKLTNQTLVIDDLKLLPDLLNRLELLKEYAIPSGAFLLNKYGKNRRIWIPVLYARYTVTGIFGRR